MVLFLAWDSCDLSSIPSSAKISLCDLGQITLGAPSSTGDKNISFVSLDLKHFGAGTGSSYLSVQPLARPRCYCTISNIRIAVPLTGFKINKPH